jgi:hypothetical protein
MRIFGALLIVVLLAMAAVLYLSREDTATSLQAVTALSADLREHGVERSPFEPERAARLIAAMQELVDHPDRISGHVDDLKTISSTAAAWADAAHSPSVELRASVALRGAAGELRSYALRPSQPTLASAARHLDTARSALAGNAVGTAPIDGVRDRLDNLERGQQERYQELEEELSR